MRVKSWWQVGLVLIAALALALVLSGCEGDDNDADATRLRVALTDQAGNFESLVIAIREVRVVRQSQNQDAPTEALDVVETFDPPLVVDILDLAFVQQVIANGLVDPGQYRQVRLVLDENVPGEEPVNYVTFNSNPGVRVPLVTPSGQQSGLKINGPFEVIAGQTNTIVLDFDPERAIVITGNNRVLLKPTGIRIVQVDDPLTQYAAISGTVSPEGAWAGGVVEVIPQGSTDPSASVEVDPEDGSFRLFVPSGTYYLHISAPGYETYNGSLLDPAVFVDANVGSETNVGEIALTSTP